MKRKMLSIFLTLALTLSLLPAVTLTAAAEDTICGDFTVTGGTLSADYTYENNVLTIISTAKITISGTSTTDRIEVASGVSADITLAGVNIDVSSMNSTAAFKIADNSTGNVTIRLADGTENILKSGSSCAGLQKSGAYSETLGTLTIEGNTGTLTATGGNWAAGIGGRQYNDGCNITINGGTVTATAGSKAAGIGGGGSDYTGGEGSHITITGGNVKATGGAEGAGIGSGRSKPGSYIEISGGTVTAKGGSEAAGIGGGNGGGGGNADGSYITISGGTVTATGGSYSAGIGGGQHGKGINITISGGTVTATGGNNGAGIGGGRESIGSNITISGGTVTATGGIYSAGIGGGGQYQDRGKGSDITISNATVTATGGNGAAGIGGAYGGAGSNIAISNSIVVAKGGTDADGIGGGRSSSGSDKPTIEGDCLVVNGATGTVTGNVTLTDDITIDESMSLEIGADASLTVGKDATLTNNGTITNNGTLDNSSGGTIESSGTLQNNSEIKGKIAVGAGGTVQTGDGSAITVGQQGGTVDSNGNVTADELTVGNTTVRGQDVKSDKEGNINVPAGSTVSNWYNPEMTLPDGGTVNKDGNVELPGGGRIRVGDTTVTAPKEGGTIESGSNSSSWGGLEVPGGFTVTTPDGLNIVLGGQGGILRDYWRGMVELPDGGSATVNGTTVTFPEGSGGWIESDNRGGVWLPAGSEMEIGDTTVTLPDVHGTIRPNADGSVEFPQDSSVKIGDTTVTLPDGGTIRPDDNGGVVLPGGSTVEFGDATATLPDGGGTIKPDDEGGMELPGGTVITKKDEKGSTTVPSQGGKLSSDGTYTENPAPSSPVTSYPITVVETANGTVTASPTSAVRGDTVTLTVTPKSGYQLKSGSLSVTDESGKDVAVSGGKTTYTFTMPDSSVTVSAEFEQIPAIVESVTLDHTELSMTVGGKAALTAVVTPAGVGTVSWSAAPSDIVEIDPDGNTATVTAKRTGIATITASIDDQTATCTVTVKAANSGSSNHSSGGSSSGGTSRPPATSEPDNGNTSPSAPPAPPTPPAPLLSDLDPGAWYQESVDYVVRNGLMTGYGDGRFGPDDTLSRAMLAQILYNAESKPDVAEDGLFADVSSGAWFSDAVAWAAANGIVSGYGGGLYGPDDPITREQLAVMLYRYAQSRDDGITGAWTPQTGYTDVEEISDWAYDAMNWCVTNGIIVGKGDALDPKSEATRAEAAAMLMRFLTRLAEK